MKETDIQAGIIKQIRGDGGHGHKWATDYAVGVPDLICGIPGLGVALIEVKFEKKWDLNRARTIKMEPKQILEINKYRATGGVAFGLVAVETMTDKLLQLCPIKGTEYGRRYYRKELLVNSIDYHPGVVDTGICDFLRNWWELHGAN